jgi:hypothetical protein
VDTSQSGAYSESKDPEWDSRVERAASADVRQLLRTVQRRRLARLLIGSVVVVALALVTVLLAKVGLFSSSGPPEARATQTGQPTEPATLAVDLTKPFAKSPAASWPNGADGITLPEAKATAGFTAEQVASATQQVRDVLVASRLDPKLLVGHDPSGFLGTLAPDARRQLEPLFGSGREAEAQSLVSMVAPDSRLLPVEPKVTGQMSVVASEAGELVVRTNYVFVYAFHTDQPDKVVDLMDILVVVRADVDYKLLTGPKWARTSQGWWYGETSGFAYSIACKAYHKGFLAPSYTERTATEVPTQDRGRYFDPGSSLPASSGCPK